MKFFKNKVLATTTIDQSVKIPRHSIFKIESINLFGKKAIEVKLDSLETLYYQDKDTIFGQVESSFFIDSIDAKNIKPFIDTLTKAIKQLGKTQ